MPWYRYLRQMAMARARQTLKPVDGHSSNALQTGPLLCTVARMATRKKAPGAQGDSRSTLMSTVVSLEKPYDKVIFDMDGTLVDSRAAVERAWRKWALKHGVPADRILAISHGRLTREVVQLFASEEMDVDRETSELESEESDDAEGIRALPGALELLLWMTDRDWAVVTSASRELASRRLSAAGLPLPDLLVCSEDVSTGKPHPQGYLLAIEQLRARPGDCLVFEDAPAGILAAKAAGCDVVAITAARPHDFEADCPSVLDFHCISFSMKSAIRPRRWQGRSAVGAVSSTER